MSLWRTLEGRIGEMCELLHTRSPRHSVTVFFSCCLRGNSMNNLSQPPQPIEPDMALLYLGSLFETLDYTLPPERDEAKLDALAWHILDKRPKTLLGLAIRARAEKHLCRYLWSVAFERLPPSDQAARVVTECDRGQPAPARGVIGRVLINAQIATPPELPSKGNIKVLYCLHQN